MSLHPWAEIQSILRRRGYGLGSTGPLKDGVDGNPGALTGAAVLAELLKMERHQPAPCVAANEITPRVALELVSHEAIVLEAYVDSVGVWTWGVGVTDASGHLVERYKDNPQSIARCLEIYIWLLRTRYLPDVLKAFNDVLLSEAQLAGALSFHYNTGAIGRASWVKQWKAGRIDEARASLMEWRKPPEIVGRRTKERDLFFDGRWSQDGKALVIPVSKPSYRPSFRGAKRVDISAELMIALAAAE